MRPGTRPRPARHASGRPPARSTTSSHRRTGWAIAASDQSNTTARSSWTTTFSGANPRARACRARPAPRRPRPPRQRPTTRSSRPGRTRCPAMGAASASTRGVSELVGERHKRGRGAPRHAELAGPPDEGPLPHDEASNRVLVPDRAARTRPPSRCRRAGASPRRRRARGPAPRCRVRPACRKALTAGSWANPGTPPSPTPGRHRSRRAAAPRSTSGAAARGCRSGASRARPTGAVTQ